MRQNGFGPLAAMLRRAFRAGRERPPRAAPTMSGWRKCGGCGRRISRRMPARTRRRGSWCPAGAGRHGRARWGGCCRRLKVADLGCGEGYLTLEASRWATRVHGGRSLGDRAAARAGAGRAPAGRERDWKRGELEKLPIRDASVDVALLSQALHHARDPQRALAEAARIVVPGGRVLVLDLREHQEAWVRDRLGDRWLGFSDERLGDAARGRGLDRRRGRRRRAAHRRGVHGARRERHETSGQITAVEDRPKTRAPLARARRRWHSLRTRQMTIARLPSSTPSAACSPGASSSSTARWAR